MLTFSRRTLLASLALLPMPAWASGGGKEGEANYQKVIFSLEFWDRNSMYHSVLVELLLVFPQQVKAGKEEGKLIANALMALSWEEFSSHNPAITIKNTAMEVLRKNPLTESITDALIHKIEML